MKCASTKERVIFHLFETTRCVQAFLVTGGCVAGSRLSFSLGFRAFEDDDIACHCLSIVKVSVSALGKRIQLRHERCGDAQATHFRLLVKQRIFQIDVFLDFNALRHSKS